ncbi:YARHG domain-containing protein [Treponema bryantii]|uniref:YARHG domain-containing protein n=1 Tax=Treponema bryantii TaxID=163 RepID=UPI0003B796B5|nr:YARHG domain-containing protein [Treponema bryantii]
MKKVFILLFLISLCFPLFSEKKESITDYYNYSLNELIPNTAKKIILGNIDLFSEYISDFDLAVLNNSDLRILRNMIYAKHGNIFSSSDLTNYYSNFNWYKPAKKVKDSDLTEEELKLIERIKLFETRDEIKKNVILKNMEGVWQDYFIMAAGWSNRFVFYENKNAEFIFSQMRYIPLAQEMHGTYEVKGNVLILKIKEIIYNSYIPEYDKINMYELDYIPNNRNTITFKNPIEFKFPIKNFELNKTWKQRNYSTNEDVEFTKDYIELGSFSYYKMSEDPNDKY